ncbi:hypothetical protein [Botrimarina colliarenosi]|uniref:hypothetical protein n=1 Tax=Botrimarina colliarenosi TaxID=2528001 RepID=UPI001E37A8F7|nr:hypothetical protein [Botrimarina colliarenosi]
MATTTATAVPVRLELRGEVASVQTSSGFQFPPSVAVKAPVVVSFAFEGLILGTRVEQASSDSVITSDFYVGPERAPTERIVLLNGMVRLGSESLRLTGGNLLVTDNKAGGACAGFSCSGWLDDEISILGFGDASAFGEGFDFTTTGGLISRVSDSEPLSDVLMSGTSVGDAATWNRFPNSILYLSLRASDGDTVGHVQIRLQRAVAIPEPTSVCTLCFAVISSALFRSGELLLA